MSTQIVDQKIIDAAKASCGDSNNLIYDEVIKIIQKYQTSLKSIIDIGMGQGKFLGLVSQTFPSAELHGADAVAYRDQFDFKLTAHQCDFNLSWNFKNQFDCVTSIEVIEHLRDPRHFLRQLQEIAKSGALLIVTTPNNESWSSILSFVLRGYFSAFSPKNYPAHITPITEYHFKQMIHENENLELVDVVYFKNGRIPGTSLKWHRFLPWLSGKRYSDNFAFIVRRK